MKPADYTAGFLCLWLHLVHGLRHPSADEGGKMSG